MIAFNVGVELRAEFCIGFDTLLNHGFSSKARLSLRGAVDHNFVASTWISRQINVYAAYAYPDTGDES